MSNMGDLQTLELTEHWKFGRREVLEVPLYVFFSTGQAM